MDWSPPKDDLIDAPQQVEPDTSWTIPEDDLLPDGVKSPAISTGVGIGRGEATSALELSDRYGVSPAMVADNMPAFQEKKREDDANYGIVRNSAPLTSDFVTQDSHTAAATLDDIHKLAKVERVVGDYGFTKMMAKGLGTGFLNVAKMAVQAPGGAMESWIGSARLAAKADELAPGIGQSLSSMNPISSVTYQALLRAGKFIEESAPDLRTPDILITNPITRYIDEKAANMAPVEIVNGSDKFKAAIADKDYLTAGRIVAANVISNAPTTAAILLSAIVGGETIALAGIGAGAAGQKSEELRAKNVPAGMAQINALGTGISEAGSEGIGNLMPLAAWGEALAGQFGKAIGKETLKAALKALAHSAASEGSEEVVNAIAEKAIDYGTGVDKNAFAQGWGTDVAFQGLVGAVAGAGPTSIMAIPTALQIHAQNVQTQNAKNFYLSLGDTIEATETRKVLPKKMREFAEKLTANSPVKDVLIPVQAFETYLQSAKEDPIDFADKLGVLKQYEEAIDTGQPLRIPTAVWAEKVVGTDHYNGFADDVKFSVNDMTVNEAKAFSEQMKAEAETRAPEMEAAGKIFDDFRQKVLGAGMTPEEADSHAMLVAERARRRAQILGEDAWSLYQRENINVARARQINELDVRKHAQALLSKYNEEYRVVKDLEKFILENGGIAQDPNQKGEYIDVPLNLRGKTAPDIMEHNAKDAGLIGKNETLYGAVKRINKRESKKSVKDFMDQARRELSENGPVMLSETGPIDVESYADYFQSNNTKLPAGWESGPARAVFLGYNPGFQDIPPVALYNIIGEHPRQRSTVSAVTLGELGIQVPETPAFGDWAKIQGTYQQEGLPPIGQFPQENQGTPKVEQFRKFFGVPHGSYADIVSRHPNFVKLDNDAHAVLNKYAELLGLSKEDEKTPISVQNFIHDRVGDIRRATYAKDMDGVKKITLQFPDIHREWMAFFWRRQSNEAVVKHVVKELDAMIEDNRPRVGIEAERGGQTFQQSAAPLWTSQLQSVIEQKMPNSAPVSMVKALIDPEKGNVKADEVEWSGINEFLSGKEKVSKTELLDFLKHNQVEIKEVMKGGDVSATKFSDYQLPGGDNYRELLLTLPERKLRNELPEGWFIEQSSSGQWVVKDRDGEVQTASKDKQKALDEAYKYAEVIGKPGASNFVSSHFKEPNILAHVRMNDRMTADGKKVLFLEEVQSDWHQRGRKEGYHSGPARAVLNEKLTAERSRLRKMGLNSDGDAYDVFDNRGKFLQNVVATSEQEALRSAIGHRSSAVPDAPFKNTWHELALKRMLRYAVDNGYDEIAWTTGEQQAERYDLSKHLSEISYSGTDLKAFDKEGKEVISQTGILPEDLPDIIGKDAAKKLLDQPPHGTLRTISGLDLKVGGEGMSGFYDKIIPSFLNKYTKKWGGKVGATEIKTGSKQTEKVHSLDITNAMRESVSQGQTMFQPAYNENRIPDLIIQHSITEEKLKHAVKIGGLAVPSLAITKESNGISGFGDITLIGRKEMADPRGYAKSKVFGADIYSPRYPTIHYKIDDKDVEIYKSSVKDALAKLGDTYLDIDELSKYGSRHLESDSYMRVQFAIDNGIDIETKKDSNGRVDKQRTGYLAEDAISSAGLLDKYKKFVESIFEKMSPQEMIYEGYTDSGKKKYKPHTIENVVKTLKMELRGGESASNIYGVGQLRAKFTPQFKSVKQIIESEGRLVGEKEFGEVKKEIESDLFKIVDDLKPYYSNSSESFGFTDTVLAVIEEAPNKGLDSSLKSYGFEDVPDFVKNLIREFISKLYTLPTEYFEAKILRAVDISEFAGAVVPDSVDSSTLDILKKNGIEIKTYKTGDKDKRSLAVSSLAKKLSDKVLFQELENNPRAQVRFGEGGINIDLFKGQDLSSLAHELWHVFAREMGQDVETVRAKDPASLNLEQRQFLADADTLLKWVGAESFATLTIEQHEQIARAGELYLREGKAPSDALKGAFSRFREWLIIVYRSVMGLNVEMTPDVREVFDRMLASQAEIAAAQAEVGSPLFADAKSVGMTDAQADKYAKAVGEARTAAEEELAAKVMAEIKKREMKPYLDRLEVVKTEVTDEINASKEYIAMSVLQRGALPDGDRAPEGMQEVKLSKDAIVAAYGEDILKRLPRPFVYSREGGIHPDMAAQIFGFRDGMELLTSLANAKPRKEAIQEAVDARMKAEFPDMKDVGKLAGEAMKAVHNEKRAELLKAEMDHLVSNEFATIKNVVRRVSRPVPSVDAVRQQAQEIIARKSPRDIYPSMYQRTEAKSAKEAVEFMLKGDMENAFSSKLRERLNHELYRAAVKAREDVDRMVDNFKRFEDDGVRRRIGKAGGSYLEQIDALLERFEFRKSVTLKELDRRKSLVQWVDEQTKAGYDVSIPQELLNEANRRSYKDTPVETLRAMTDTIDTIEHLAGLKNKLLKNERSRTLEEARGEMLGSLAANHKMTGEKKFIRNPTVTQKMKGFSAYVIASHVKMESLFKWLDGDTQGAFYRHFWKPFLDAKHYKAQKLAESGKTIRSIFGVYTKAEMAKSLLSPEYIPEINERLTKSQILAIALNTGNEYNLKALMDGERWSTQQMQAILNRLEKRDWDVVQGVWDHINSFWPEVSALEKRINGMAPEKVESRTVETKFGPYRGGYYPISFDVSRSRRMGELKEGEMVQDLFGGQFAKAMTRHGHTISRVGTAGRPLSTDLSVISSHIENVIHDLAYREAVIDANRLADDDQIMDAIAEIGGDEIVREFKPWVRAIAGDRVQSQVRWIERLISHVRHGATIANLGFRLSSAFAQTMGYFNTVDELGPKYAALGLSETVKEIGGIGKLWEFISEKSPDMAMRRQTFDRDAREAMRKSGIVGSGSGVTGAMNVYKSGVNEAFFWATSFMDLATSVPTWLGAYRKALEGNVKDIAINDEKAAIAYADSVVRLTQSAGDVMDLASIQRGGELMKTFTMFYSQLSLQFNLLWKTSKQFQGTKNVPKLVGAMAALWFAPAIMEEIIRGRGPDDDEKWWEWAAKQEITYPFQTVVLLRDIVSGMQRMGYEPSPAYGAFEAATKMAKVAVGVVTGEKEDMTRGDVRNIVNTVGYFAHLPTRQLYQTVEYLLDWMSGDQEPDNIMEGVWRALVIGKKRDK